MVVYRVSEFFDKYYNKKFQNHEEFLTEYQALLEAVESSSGKSISTYDPVVKGQPPRSQQFNKFSAQVGADSAIISRQIDNVAAKTINMHNLFDSEIKKEFNHLARINSKVKILQLYSKSFSDDLFYIGDDFSTSQNIENQVTMNYQPALISNGVATLPIVESSAKWSPSQSGVSILNFDQSGRQVSNGFVGNSHMVFFDPTDKTAVEEQALKNPANYQYYGVKSTSLNKLGSMIDKDTEGNTYFEYEKYNVSNLNSSAFDYEFKYKITNNGTTNMISWANADDSPLQMTLVLDRTQGRPANSITIKPFFGYDEVNINSLAVSSIKIESTTKEYADKGPEEILKNEILIGETLLPASSRDNDRYFFKEATIKFAERDVKKVTITFKQYSFTGVKIKHVYWTVEKVVGRYSFDSNSGKGFENAIRAFEPERLFSERNRFSPTLIPQAHSIKNLTGIDNAYNVLLPDINNPIAIARSPQSSTAFITLAGDSEINFNYSLMKVKNKRQNLDVYVDDNSDGFDISEQSISNQTANRPTGATPSGSSQNWWPAIFEVQGTAEKTQAKKFVNNQSSATDISSSIYRQITYNAYATPNFATMSATPSWTKDYLDLHESIKSWWGIAHTLTDEKKMGTNYKLNYNEIVEEKQVAALKPKATYNIRLKKNYEILSDGQRYGERNETLNVKRWSIGIRDISIGSEQYADIGELISRPYSFPGPIEFLMLRSDHYIPTEVDSAFFDKETRHISYYISVDDASTWLPISPVEDPFFAGIPEIYAFNRNSRDEEQLPGIHYVNYPFEVKSIRVKIELRKPYYKNGTPVIRGYQLAARINRL